MIADILGAIAITGGSILLLIVAGIALYASCYFIKEGLDGGWHKKRDWPLIGIGAFYLFAIICLGLFVLAAWAQEMGW